MWTGDYDRKFKDEEKPKERLPFKVSGELTIILSDGTKIEIPENIDESPVVVSGGKARMIVNDDQNGMVVSLRGKEAIVIKLK